MPATASKYWTLESVAWVLHVTVPGTAEEGSDISVRHWPHPDPKQECFGFWMMEWRGGEATSFPLLRLNVKAVHAYTCLSCIQEPP